MAFEIDAQGSLSQMSDAWFEFTGQTADQARGTGWLDAISGASLMLAVEHGAAALARGESIEWDCQCRRKDGTWCPLRWLISAVRDPNTVVRFRGLGTPVPSREADDAMHREVWAEALMAASSDLMFQLDAAGVFLGFRGNNALLYSSPEHFVGAPLEGILPPVLAKQTRDALEAAKATGQRQQFTYPLRVGDEERHFETRIVATRRGEFLQLVRDVTDAVRNEAELVAAREEALERSALKTQFLANVSHEIRTPLNGILGVTQLLKQQSIPAEFQEYVDVLQSAGESLLSIVNDVLDLSKIEANRLELESRVFDLAHVVSETARSFWALAQRKGLELVVDIEPQAKGPVRGDANRIRQALTNLLSNALKFTDHGSVRVSVTRRDDKVSILVADTGPGLAPEHHARVFEPFEQADVAIQRRYGGTGLGLAITRRLARLMGGDVSMTSEVGVGASFLFEVSIPSVVISSVPQTAVKSLGVRKSLRVLLAEDEPTNALMTSALLSKLGHAVRVVDNGVDCVSETQKGDVDLVLMDVHMPALDGLAATRAIRERERGTKTHLPIVALTADAMKGDDLRCLSAGMDAYLPKPVTVGALTDLLSWFGCETR
jgi:signal transduction histidine kinase